MLLKQRILGRGGKTESQTAMDIRDLTKLSYSN